MATRRRRRRRRGLVKEWMRRYRRVIRYKI